MSRWETKGGQMTSGETFAMLMEHLRLAQEDAAMLSHLHRAYGTGADLVLAKGWLNVSEGLKQMQERVTEFARRGLQ